MERTLQLVKSGLGFDAVQIGQLFTKAKSSMIDSLNYYIECGKRLKAVKDSLSHGEWLPWLEENEEVLGFGDSTARRMIGAAEANQALTHDFSESDALTLSRQIWSNSVHNYRALGTGNNDWHTPLEYIQAAREVLGVIDLDPASSLSAQAAIKAQAFFTPKDDGLSKAWQEKVWLNPPYSQPFIVQFIEKLIREYLNGHVTEAILLTHNHTDTAWFHAAEKEAALICFTRGRIQFIQADGTIAQPTQGQAFFYFGNRAERFQEVFSGLGFVR